MLMAMLFFARENHSRRTCSCLFLQLGLCTSQQLSKWNQVTEYYWTSSSISETEAWKTTTKGKGPCK
ncbi:hypothetical protein Y1Q_0008191 [Alligator mississippiensis]|uniref:Uncharacterized protein n=1 Tax=Alligator mississippiensis TaxID=8496 RepID=A0A151N1K9_ALLMI|nr:hypothetical protein Y1Q_0008191 [Alligator mississippiensis]